MKTTNLQKLEDFFGTIYRDLSHNSVNDFIEFSEVDYTELSFEWLIDELRDKNFFDVEIIYYGSAMEYLTENDCSLNESLSIASEYGFSLEDLNSEKLASLLASRNFEDDFMNYESEISDLFNEIIEDEEMGDDEE